LGYFSGSYPIPSGLLPTRSQPPVLRVFPLPGLLTASPFAPCAFTHFITTMDWSDFCQSIVGLRRLYAFSFPTSFEETARSPRYAHTTYTLAKLSDPGGSAQTRFSPFTLLPAAEPRASASAHTLTRLYRFTLAYFGSRAPLPTLTSRLTALMPRLCTGRLLRFPGTGLSPIYVMCAELAHRFYRLVRLTRPFCRKSA